MIRRATIVGLVVLVPLVADSASGRAAAGQAQAEAQAVSPFYIGRGDPRLCPSPECGGAWVRLVNRSATGCGGGGTKRECYVASIDVSRVRVRESLRPRLASVAASGLALVRGRLVRGRIARFPELSTLVVSEVWPGSSAAGPPRGPFRLLLDNGVRCVTTPCFSTDARRLNSRGTTTISRLDLSRLHITRAERDHAREKITTGGLIVAGPILVDPSAGPAGAGRVLVASQLYVRAGS